MRPTAILAGLVMGGLLAGTAGATPDDTLWEATAEVESGGNPRAYRSGERAAGIVQIRPICVADVNRILRLWGDDRRFALADRYSLEKSREMWEVYLEYYGDRYAQRTGRAPTDEVYARIWNGGPEGWCKRRTLLYWRRIREAIP